LPKCKVVRKCHEFEISNTFLILGRHNTGFVERITDFVNKLSNAHISQQLQLWTQLCSNAAFRFCLLTIHVAFYPFWKPLQLFIFIINKKTIFSYLHGVAESKSKTEVFFDVAGRAEKISGALYGPNHFKIICTCELNMGPCPSSLAIRPIWIICWLSVKSYGFTALYILSAVWLSWQHLWYVNF